MPRIPSFILASSLLVYGCAPTSNTHEPHSAETNSREAEAPKLFGEVPGGSMELAPGQTFLSYFVTSGPAAMDIKFNGVPEHVHAFIMLHPQDELTLNGSKIATNCRGANTAGHEMAPVSKAAHEGLLKYDSDRAVYEALVLSNRGDTAARLDLNIVWKAGQIAFVGNTLIDPSK